MLTLIAGEATMVTPTEQLTISKHEFDHRFYECAAAAGADDLVTGNTRHFPEAYKTTKIINTRQLRNSWAELKEANN